jgi:hypothetical protein
MKKGKNKISITLNKEVYEFLDKFENKSKYIENLIYKELKELNIVKKEIIL